MRRFILLLALTSLAFAGCGHIKNNACRPCGRGCGINGCRAKGTPDYVPHIPHNFYKQVGPAGPPTATYAYPYYTVRAPRDFLSDQPSTIGH